MWLVPYLVTPACDCSRLSELARDFRVPLVPGDRDHDYASAAYDYFAMLDTTQMILGCHLWIACCKSSIRPRDALWLRRSRIHLYGTRGSPRISGRWAAIEPRASRPCGADAGDLGANHVAGR